MRHFIIGDNIGLLTCRQSAINSWEHVGITKYIVDDCRVSNRTKERGYVFPLYIYEAAGTRLPNLKMDIVDKISQNIGLEYETEKSGNTDKFAPIDLFDYVYAVLHSPIYREKYKEFLKTDFPCIPYPSSADEFRRLSEIGCQLRQIHLMEHPELNILITQYPIDGSNSVEKVRLEALSDTVGRVWINDKQYFDSVPLKVWEFYIGGYQPAQKWLKDRQGSILSYEDLVHYQRIVKALAMTDEIMGEIDNQ